MTEINPVFLQNRFSKHSHSFTLGDWIWTENKGIESLPQTLIF